MSLTAIQVKQATAKEKPYKLYDSQGLYLLVKPEGGKYWRFKYRWDGKEKNLALGTLQDVTLSEARTARDNARKQIKSGTDPSQSKKTAKRLRRIQSTNTFEAIAREWHAHQEPRWSENHAYRIIDCMERDVFPVIGQQPIADIVPPDVIAMLRGIESRGVRDYPKRVLQRTRAVFRYAVQTGRATQNPAIDLGGVLKANKTVNRPALSREDLPDFLEKLKAYDGHLITKLGLQLLMLTFVRPGELRRARWSEFDLERAEWRIPAERMKMGAEHIVPLSTQALETLREIQPISGHFALMFAGRNNPRRPMSENTLTNALNRMGYKGKATAHGFRATASTILNESGFKPDVIERQLAHAERNKVRAAYHRSEYLQERRDMMQWWADYLDSVKRGAKVVPINSTKRAKEEV